MDSHASSTKLRNSIYALLFLAGILGLSILLEGCTDTCEVTHRYIYYEPVYSSLAEVRSGLALQEARPLTEVGKIYLKDGFLFVNHPGKGIHIIDNRTPSQPVVKSFLKIPGNYDLAIKGSTLYADSFLDLVALDISDLSNIQEVKRLENFFSHYNNFGFAVDATKGIVTEWVPNEKVTITESECSDKIQPWGGFLFQEGIALRSDIVLSSAAIAPGTGSGSGVGGSMARFTLKGERLYALDLSSLRTVNVNVAENPVEENKLQIAWDIETIFPYGNHLFIGSRSGMHIIDITTPNTPQKISTYEHVRVCDPVVVQDTLAYVTLRSGTTCQGFTNQLEVINIKNLQSPQMIKTYAMTNPHGLGIDESTLFICDGDAGLKVYNAADAYAIDKNLLAHYKNINAYDVIPFNDLLIMIGDDGIFQYNYSNPKAIKFLSKIEVKHEN